MQEISVRNLPFEGSIPYAVQSAHTTLVASRLKKPALLRWASILFAALFLTSAFALAQGTGTVTGTVFTPNGTDPLPNVLVYVPSTSITPFAAGVKCLQAGTPASGSPVTYTYTATDGTFTLNNVPVGINVPIVIQKGLWRRQDTIPAVVAGANTFSTRMPQTQAEGDIPHIALVTGNVDAVECVLRKVGVADSEFTTDSGAGRIHIYTGTGAAGSDLGAGTSDETALMSDASKLATYDMVMYPCQGNTSDSAPSSYQGNLINWAAAGGRVYATHFSYLWLDQGIFSTTAIWDEGQPHPADGTATVDTSFPGGSTLADWLVVVGVIPHGSVNLNVLRHDIDGVVAPTQSWMTLNDPGDGNPVMQMTFNTPVGGTVDSQCGRVLFNEYHVEDRSGAPTGGSTFPAECTGGVMTDQEKVLEYSLFDLSSYVGPDVPPTVSITSSTTPAQFTQGESSDTVDIAVTNTSATTDTNHWLTFSAALPTGLSANSIQGKNPGTGWTCVLGTLTCTRTTGLAHGVSDPITINVSVDAHAPVGSASVNCKASGGALASEVITPAAVTILGVPSVTWATPAAITYPTPLSATQLNAAGNTTGTLVYTPPSGTVLHAGSHSLSVLYTSTDSNYPGTATTSVSQVVNQAAQAITFTPASPVSYGVSPISLSATGGGSGNTIAFSLVSGPATLVGSTLTITGVGSVVVQADQAGNSDYLDAPAVQATIVVNKANASVTPNAAGKTYGTADPALSGTLTGFVAGDAVTAAYSRIAGESVGGSPYVISAVLSPAGVLANYNITYNTANFTINKANASVTPDALGKTYGAADPSLTGSTSGFLVADGVTATYSRIAGESVGSSPYTISAVLAPGGILGNYNITYNTANFTISKKNASVTPNAAGKTYGAADPSLTGTLSGFLVADGVTATYSRVAGESVGSSPYTISAVLAPGGVLGNYNITYNTANFTIGQANASVTPDVSSKTYGGTDPSFTGTLLGFQVADGVSASYSRTAGETVGGSPYSISAVLSPAGVLGNYNITYNTANFTITKALASVTPDPATKVYGTADPTFTGTLLGFMSGDSVTAAYSRAAGENVAGSPYAISAVLGPVGVLPNYTITYHTANFTITKAPQVITFPVVPTKTYLDLPVTLTATGGGSGNTVTYSIVSGPGSIAGNQLTITGAGTIVVRADQAGNSNYFAAPSVTQSILVNKAPQSITWNPASPVLIVATPVTLNAVSMDVLGASGLPILYTVNSGPATVLGNQLSLLSGGLLSVSADQPGNANFLPAPTVTKTILVIAECDKAPTLPVGATSTTQTAVIRVLADFTLGSISVGMAGEPGKDYSFVSGGTCSVGTAYHSGDSCTVLYTLTPSKPGTRLGNILLSDNAGTPVVRASLGLDGTGTGPLAAFYASAPAAVDTNLNFPEGVAADAHGNLFFTAINGSQTLGTGAKVIEEAWDGSAYTQQAIVSTGLNGPFGIAVDCRGNLYFADEENNRIVKETWNGTGYTQSTVDGSLSHPNGVAVDCNGNVYVADSGNSRVLKETWWNGAYTRTTVADSSSSNISGPQGVAVDHNGNVYILDSGRQRCLKETPSGGGYIEQTITTGLAAPLGIAVDANGNVFISDTNTGRVLKETVSGGSYVESVMPTTGVNMPYGLTIDEKGNLFVCDPKNNRIVKVDATTAPSLTFATTAVGTTSSDSPQTVSFTNVGNAPMSFAVPGSGNNPAISANFSLDSSGGSACPLVHSTDVSPGTLAANATCTLPVSFTPGVAGSLAGSLVLTDDSLNVAASTQTIPLSGLAVPAGTTATVLTVSPNPSWLIEPVIFTANVTAKVGGAGATGTVQFSVDGVPTGSAITLAAGKATLTDSALTVGTHTIAAVYTPAGGSGYLASTATPVSQVVILSDPKIALQFDSTSLTYPGATNLTACVSSGTKIAPWGSLGIYDGATLIKTLGLQGNGCAYWYISPGLSAGSHVITAQYSGDSSNDPGISAPTTLTVSAIAVKISAVCGGANIVYGVNYKCTVTVSSNAGSPTGSINYTLDAGATQTAALTSGNATFTLTKPNTGAHTVTIAYPTTGGFGGVSAPVQNFTVSGAPVLVSLTPSSFSPQAGTAVTFTAKVTSQTGGTPNATGSVAFTDNGAALATVAVNATGQAVYSTSSLTVGVHTILATYSGGTNYGTNTGAATVTISQWGQTITFNGLPSTATYAAGLTYTLTATSTSALPVTYAVTGPASVVGSTLTVTGAGTVVVTASQVGNAKYKPATPQVRSLIVSKVASSTVVSAATLTPSVGVADLLTATVSGLGAPTGSVLFTAGSTTICASAPITAGVATCNYTPVATGGVSITARYLGDTGNSVSVGTKVLSVLGAVDSQISLQFTSTNLTYPGATNMTVCVASTKKAAATGTVTIKDGITTLTVLALQGNGCAYWYISPGLAAGTHSITAVYSGDTNNPAGTSAATTVTVNHVPVVMNVACGSLSFPYGVSYTCQVAVSSNAGSALGAITWALDGGAATPVTLSGGTARFTVTKPAAGTHTVAIGYAQQTNYAAATSQTEYLNVAQAHVIVTTWASVTTVKAGNSVSITAQVNSATAGIPPTGSVSFFDNGVLLAAVAVTGSGQEVYTTSALAVGTHVITATYNGSPNYAVSSTTSNPSIKVY